MTARDFPIFIANKQLELAYHFTHWKSLDQNQRAEIEQVLRGAILGFDVTLQRGKRTRIFDFSGNERRRTMLPLEIVKLLVAAGKERLKQGH